MTDDEAERFCLQGTRLSAGAAAQLDERLREEPLDTAARLQLIGFTRGESRHQHILQQISLEPEHAPFPFCLIDHTADVAGYTNGRIRWIAAVNANRENLRVIRNAARFFLLAEPSFGLALLDLATGRDAAWHIAVGSFCEEWMLLCSSDPEGLGEVGDRCRRAYSEAFDATSGLEERTRILWSLRECARSLGEAWRSRLYGIARDLLTRSATDDTVAIAEGLVALASGNNARAEERLLRAVRLVAPGVLPPMVLARELVGVGRRDSAAEYLAVCARNVEAGAGLLLELRERILAGEPWPEAK